MAYFTLNVAMQFVSHNFNKITFDNQCTSNYFTFMKRFRTAVLLKNNVIKDCYAFLWTIFSII